MFISYAGTAYEQSCKTDWSGFANSDWTLNYFNDTSSFLDKTTQGRLIFKNKSDSLLTLTYYIYLKSDIDSAFEQKIMFFLFSQSCMTLDNGKVDFKSFYYFRHYYYLLKPCHKCNTGLNKDCEKLAEQMIGFIETK